MAYDFSTLTDALIAFFVCDANFFVLFASLTVCLTVPCASLVVPVSAPLASLAELLVKNADTIFAVLKIGCVFDFFSSPDLFASLSIVDAGDLRLTSFSIFVVSFGVVFDIFASPNSFASLTVVGAGELGITSFFICSISECQLYLLLLLPQ